MSLKVLIAGMSQDTEGSLVPTGGSTNQVLAKASAADGDFTWITLSGGGDALVANPLSQFAATTSAQLRGVLSDESGTGAALFAGGNIGAATGTSLQLSGLMLSTSINLDNGTGGTAVLDAAALTDIRAWDFPDADGTFVGTATAQTLTNKTISGATNTITNVPVSTGISGLGTGVATALAVNVGTAGAPVVLNGALGTPSSAVLTNATGLPLSGLAQSSATSGQVPTWNGTAWAAATPASSSGASKGLMLATSFTCLSV